MYISDTSITFQQARGFHQHYLYKLSGDTITYYQSDIENRNPPYTLKAIVKVVNDSSMVWATTNPLKLWNFKKLNHCQV
jgi:hypothetical protein